MGGVVAGIRPGYIARVTRGHAQPDSPCCEDSYVRLPLAETLQASERLQPAATCPAAPSPATACRAAGCHSAAKFRGAASRLDALTCSTASTASPLAVPWNTSARDSAAMLDTSMDRSVSMIRGSSSSATSSFSLQGGRGVGVGGVGGGAAGVVVSPQVGREALGGLIDQSCLREWQATAWSRRS